jgi:hypothetical protein
LLPLTSSELTSKLSIALCVTTSTAAYKHDHNSRVLLPLHCTQTAEASIAAGLQTAAAQQPLAVQTYSCDAATPTVQLPLLQHLGSSLSSVKFNCHYWTCGGAELPAGFKARWRSVLGQPAAALAALSGLRSLQVTECYGGSSVAVGHLQLSALRQLTSLRLLGRSEVPAKQMRHLPGEMGGGCKRVGGVAPYGW